MNLIFSGGKFENEGERASEPLKGLSDTYSLPSKPLIFHSRSLSFFPPDYFSRFNANYNLIYDA